MQLQAGVSAPLRTPCADLVREADGPSSGCRPAPRAETPGHIPPVSPFRQYDSLCCCLCFAFTFWDVKMSSWTHSMRTSGKNKLKSWRDKKSVPRCTSWSRPLATPVEPSDSFTQWPIIGTSWSSVSGFWGQLSSSWSSVNCSASFQHSQGSTRQNHCLNLFFGKPA